MADAGRDVRLSTVIMTHPARLDRAEKLAARLAELAPVCVVDDTGPGQGNLGNAVRAWSAVAPDATHQLVLQDDVVPCDGFADRVRRAVRARPHDAVSLFCEWGSRSASLVRAAAWQGLSWARVVDMYTPSQGLVLPRRAALDFAAGVTDPTGPDDLALWAYLRRAGRSTLVTVPNLLEHDDRVSLTGNGFQGLRRSACPPAGGDAEPDVTTGVAGEGLTWLPYVSWMRVHAEWVYCGDVDAYAWVGEVADTRLPEGLRTADLVGRFHADLAGSDPALPGAVSEVTLFDFWVAYFALGLTAPAGTRPPPGPLAGRAFGTALPGAFRRFLPVATLDAARSAAGGLAASAFAAGVAADVARPHPAWYADAPA